MESTRPLFLWDFDERDSLAGGYLNSIVMDPAMESKAIFLSKTVEEYKQTSLKINHDKQIITGAVLIPLKKILRKRGDQYVDVFFTEEKIEKYVRHFFKDPQNILNSNLEHSIPLTGLRLVESWIVVDPQCDKSVALGLGIFPKGTWLCSYYIEDKNLYNMLKSNPDGFGFSIEAYLNELPIPDAVLPAVENILCSKEDSNINDNTNKTNSKMKKFLSKIFLNRKEKVSLMDFKLIGGNTLNIDDTTGICTVDGQLAVDGDYVLEDGTVVSIGGSTIWSVGEIDNTILILNEKENGEAKTDEAKTVTPPVITDEKKDETNADATADVQTLSAEKVRENDLKQIEFLSKEIVTLKEQVTQIVSLTEAAKAKDEEITALKAEVEKLKEAPLKSHTDLAPTTNSDTSKMSFSAALTAQALQRQKK